MPQSAMTVRIDSEMKKRFDELCNKFGMSANTAINVFVNAVVRTRSIPFDITSPNSSREKMKILFEQARQSIDYSKPEMTLDEINEEIRLAREELKAKAKS